jgi:hypothetical protein
MTDGELRDFCVQIVRDHIFKWQISPVPGKIDLSMTMGVLLPTGPVEIAGRGAQPYVQFPWSWELHDGWGLSGMFTEFFRPKSDVLQRHKWDKEERRKITRQFWIFWVVIGLAAALRCAIIGRQELLRISVSPKWTVR